MPSEEHRRSSPAGSESGTESTLTGTRHESHFLSWGENLDVAAGEQPEQPPVRGRAGTSNSEQRYLGHSSRFCAALCMATLLTFQHLFSFYTKASQGPVRQRNISVDISVPERAALLWLCIRHLWLCQK